MMKPVSLVLSWQYLLPKIVWTTEYIYMHIYFKDLERFCWDKVNQLSFLINGGKL